MDDRVRSVIYDVTMREGTPPSSERVAQSLGVDRIEVLQSFRRLAEARMLVVDPDSHEILMAGPFSAVATPFRVTTAAYSCYANCIWDSLGIAATLNENVEVETSCADCGEPAALRVADGEVKGGGFMHFVVPARLWWSHIVYT